MAAVAALACIVFALDVKMEQRKQLITCTKLGVCHIAFAAVMERGWAVARSETCRSGSLGRQVQNTLDHWAFSVLARAFSRYAWL